MFIIGGRGHVGTKGVGGNGADDWGSGGGGEYFYHYNMHCFSDIYTRSMHIYLLQ